MATRRKKIEGRVPSVLELRFYQDFEPIGWTGGRNYGHDHTGEMVRAEGYTYRRELFRSLLNEQNMWGWGPAFFVTAQLVLNTERTRMRLFVYLNSSISTEIPVIAWSPCKSVPDAQARADAALKQENWVRKIFMLFYQNRVYILTPDGALFAVLFCEDYMVLPEGEYIVESHNVKRRLRRFGSGFGLDTPMKGNP